MKPLTKIEISIICVVLCISGYFLFSHNTLYRVDHKVNITDIKHKYYESDSPILSVNFTNKQHLRNLFHSSINDGDIKFSESAKLNLLKNESFYSYQSLVKIGNIKRQSNNFKIDFTDIPINNINKAESNFADNNGVVINDELYKIANQNVEEISGNNEIIFVSDNVENKLISCATTNNNYYTCHTAVSNLDNPQDILVINQYIYIIDAHKDGESGDVTRCNITDSGYIDGCGQTPVDIINPIFFYYNPPYVYISDFVYAGNVQSKPKQVIKCTIANNGDFINCNNDDSSFSMSYISKYYNQSYYRPHSYLGVSSIERCGSLFAGDCQQMTNKVLVYPLSISINNDRIFITNAKSGNAASEVLKCSMDMTNCTLISDSIKSPMCIGVFNPRKLS